MPLPTRTSSRVYPGVGLLAVCTTSRDCRLCSTGAVTISTPTAVSSHCSTHIPILGLVKCVIWGSVRGPLLTHISCAFFSIHASVWADGLSARQRSTTLDN